MHITTNNTTNCNDYRPKFASRNPIIRDLGDISMLVKREFPLISNTNIEAKNNHSNQAYKLLRYSTGLIDEIRSFTKIDSTPVMKVIKSIDAMKQFMVGNCGETSLVTYLACKMNGYQNAKLMSLVAYDTKTKKIRQLDHTVVGVNFCKPSDIKTKGYGGNIYIDDNSGIIVDSWLGKVDYGKNMKTEYAYSNFGVKLSPDEKLYYGTITQVGELSSNDMLYIENQYPSIVKNRKNGFLKRIRYLLMQKNKYKYEPIRNSLKEVYKKNSALKNALTQDEISNMINEEIKAEENAKIKKKNFVYRFLEDANIITPQK